MDSETLFTKLGTIDFFKDFSADEKNYFLVNKMFCAYPDGKKIIVEGAQDRTFYVLIDGRATVTKNANPDVVLAELDPGSVFGEIAHFARQQRATNVLAKGNVFAFRLEHDHFKKLPAEVKLKINFQAMAILMQRLEKTKKSRN